MTDDHHTRATLENQAFALMGRLHVILRRQTGRVTDIEYMRIDPAYCRYLLKLASLSDNADLRDIGAKLEEVYFGPEGLFVKGESRPLLARLTEQQTSPAVPNTSASTVPETDDPVDRGYIGRLR
jgi:hypothetical protein